MYYGYILQNTQISKTCSLKMARHKIPYVILYHLHEISRKGKAIETDNRVMGT